MANWGAFGGFAGMENRMGLAVGRAVGRVEVVVEVEVDDVTLVVVVELEVVDDVLVEVVDEVVDEVVVRLTRWTTGTITGIRCSCTDCKITGLARRALGFGREKLINMSEMACCAWDKKCMAMVTRLKRACCARKSVSESKFGSSRRTPVKLVQCEFNRLLVL